MSKSKVIRYRGTSHKPLVSNWSGPTSVRKYTPIRAKRNKLERNLWAALVGMRSALREQRIMSRVLIDRCDDGTYRARVYTKDIIAGKDPRPYIHVSITSAKGGICQGWPDRLYNVARS